MKNYHLMRRNDRWELSVTDGVTIATYETKAEGVQSARRVMARHPGTLKIHRVDGTIEEERTYPRSADPSKSAG